MFGGEHLVHCGKLYQQKSPPHRFICHCKCGAHWDYDLGKDLQSMFTTFVDHVRYAEKPATVVL